MIDVVVLGEIIFDITVGGFNIEMPKKKVNRMISAAKFSGGGDAQNAATTMGYLGLETWLSGRVGDDEAGKMCVSYIEAAGVNCSRIIRVKGGSTATSVNLVQEGGEAACLVFKGENSHYSNEDIPLDLFSRARFVSLHSLFSLPGLDAGAVFRKAHECGAKTFADTTVVRGYENLDLLKDVLPVLDIFAPSYAEAANLTKKEKPEDMARVLLDQGVEMAVIKLGPDGCLVADRSGLSHVKGYKTGVVNTTGAGDNFTAGFLYGMCQGYSKESCGKCGNAAGSITCSGLSSTGLVRSSRQLKDYIISHNDRIGEDVF
jgi:sugar/nucleoside kinase (ribokinase family)